MLNNSSASVCTVHRFLWENLKAMRHLVLLYHESYWKMLPFWQTGIFCTILGYTHALPEENQTKVCVTNSCILCGMRKVQAPPLPSWLPCATAQGPTWPPPPIWSRKLKLEPGTLANLTNQCARILAQGRKDDWRTGALDRRSVSASKSTFVGTAPSLVIQWLGEPLALEMDAIVDSIWSFCEKNDMETVSSHQMNSSCSASASSTGDFLWYLLPNITRAAPTWWWTCDLFQWLTSWIPRFWGKRRYWSHLSKMGAQKKVKKSNESINSRLALVMKSGKYMLGYKQTLKTLR